MNQSCRLTRVAKRQKLRATGDFLFTTLYVVAGVANVALLFSF